MLSVNSNYYENVYDPSLPVNVQNTTLTVDDVANNPAVLMITGTKNTTASADLIAAPAAGHRIVLVGFTLQNNAATAQTFTLIHGTTNIFSYVSPASAAGDTVTIMLPAGREFRLPAAAALAMTLSAATATAYNLIYYVEAAA